MQPKQFPETLDEAVGVVIAALSDDEKARMATVAQFAPAAWGSGLGTSLGCGRGTAT